MLLKVASCLLFSFLQNYIDFFGDKTYGQKDYWANEEALNDDFISSHMPLQRFSWILGRLHLKNNLELKKGDKILKVQPYLDHLSNFHESALFK